MRVSGCDADGDGLRKMVKGTRDSEFLKVIVKKYDGDGDRLRKMRKGESEIVSF